MFFDRFPPRLSMAIAIFLYAAVEVFLKTLAERYSPMETIFYRSVVALGFSLLLHPAAVFRLKTYKNPYVWGRGIAATLNLTLGVMALKNVQLASFVSIFYAAPLMLTVFSYFLFKEKVSKHQWIVLIVGFGGILFLMNPSTELFSFSGLISLLSVTCYVVSLLFARMLSQESSAVQYTSFSVLSLCLMAPFIGSFKVIELADIVLFAGMAAVHYGAFMSLTSALKRAPVSQIAPIEYTSLLWSIVMGWVFFQDIPQISILIGALIIAGSCLWNDRKTPSSTPEE